MNDYYKIIGIDNSLNMLRVAKTRAYNNFKVICADIKNFHISKKADFIFSVHDTMNYLLNFNDIHKVLDCVKNIMHKDSIFMFDMTTEYNIFNNFDGKSTRYDIRGTQVEWKNTYDTKKKLVHSFLKFYRPDGTIKKEEHIQRIYSINEIKNLLYKENFEIINIFGDYSFLPPGKKTVMVNYITRKK